MKGLLTYDRRSMDPNTQIGYLLAMVNGDVNNRIPEWAKSFQKMSISAMLLITLTTTKAAITTVHQKPKPQLQAEPQLRNNDSHATILFLRLRH